MATFTSHSPDETAALGEKWGATAKPGWLIGLTGVLGAGKTQLVKGLARGLGCPGRVHSPTFLLVQKYPGGRLPLAHLDLYRLETPEQVLRAGLESYLLQPEGITVVEWIDRWPDFFTRSIPHVRRRRVSLEALNETERRITYEDLGA